MFPPQTTEIQPFKVECFSTKMVKFQQYVVINYYVSADFLVLFAMWNSVVMSYPCVKFHHDMAIEIGYNLHLFCVFLDNRQRSKYNDVMTSLILCPSFFIFELRP